MSPLERALREDIDRLALTVLTNSDRTPTSSRPISFARFRNTLIAFPAPGRWEGLLERIWPNNPLTRFNRRARNAEELAYWKTVWR